MASLPMDYLRMITNCSNNAGPYQFSGKISFRWFILKEPLAGNKIFQFMELCEKCCGTGFMYDEHARALLKVVRKTGVPGENLQHRGHNRKKTKTMEVWVHIYL